MQCQEMQRIVASVATMTTDQRTARGSVERMKGRFLTRNQVVCHANAIARGLQNDSKPCGFFRFARSKGQDCQCRQEVCCTECSNSSASRAVRLPRAAMARATAS